MACYVCIYYSLSLTFILGTLRMGKRRRAGGRRWSVTAVTGITVCLDLAFIKLTTQHWYAVK